MYSVVLALAGIYAAIILVITLGMFFLNRKKSDQIGSFSIIIAARNEEKHIGDLLEILTQLEYPKDKYEIIIADDRSTDKTSEIVGEYQKKNQNLKLIHIENEDPQLIGKKGALDKAIRISSYDRLVFTDGDCLPDKKWLQEINRYWTDEVDFWAGYSPLILRDPFISLLKNLERASIFAVTAGTFGLHWGVTCTARNMGYRKSLFIKSNGYSGIGDIRSGDDDLLLQKMSCNVRKFSFLFGRGSIVRSWDRDAAKDQIELETRRGSKWKYYPFPVKLLSLFVFIFYLFFILGMFQTITGSISLTQFWNLVLIKVIPEFLILLIFLVKIKELKLLLAFPLAELLYIPYFIYFGIRGTLGKYKWK
ncbi:glycosyltransferase [Candidatus Cloacimonadota bacterium]